MGPCGSGGRGQRSTMGIFRDVERVMERWGAVLWARLWPPRHRQAEVVAILRRRCDDTALILDRERVLVPNAFVIELPPAVHEQLTAEERQLRRQLSVQLRRHAAERGYVFAGPVAVDLRPSREKAVGRFRIHSRIAPAVRR
ncbi:FhaA domain-containing protein [Streptomyces monticola]|uniref:FhaA domain-containing protein n=1 Tax=Streptomyces monticola TaxID=2666263 RepID=A0ABW2JM96_9ACTN